jgi:hypothetical protein
MPRNKEWDEYLKYWPFPLKELADFENRIFFIGFEESLGNIKFFLEPTNLEGKC